VIFCYHNHDHEFRRFAGPDGRERAGLELLLELTDPQVVRREVDVAWVTFGGADPVAFLQAHAGRCPILHMKDFAHLHRGSHLAQGVRQEAVFTEVGTGVVNTDGVVDAAAQADVSWLVIEQDRMNQRSPRASLETSVRNLRALRDAVVG
jgi:sugar phosphate isomerase/epimerase